MRKKDRDPEGSASAWSSAPSKRITPADVQQKEFPVARFGGGYRMREVDEFLDQVTDSLSALVAENARLRDGATSGSAPLVAPDAPIAANVEDRSAIEAFLRREKGFLQSLGGLVQGHAEELREMVRVARRAPHVQAPSAPAPEAAVAVADDIPSVEPEGAEETVESAAPAAGTDASEEQPGDSESDPGAEGGSAPEQPIRLEDPEPARSAGGDEGPEGSLRELFWGEE